MRVSLWTDIPSWNFQDTGLGTLNTAPGNVNDVCVSHSQVCAPVQLLASLPCAILSAYSHNASFTILPGGDPMPQHLSAGTSIQQVPSLLILTATACRLAFILGPFRLPFSSHGTRISLCKIQICLGPVLVLAGYNLFLCLSPLQCHLARQSHCGPPACPSSVLRMFCVIFPAP